MKKYFKIINVTRRQLALFLVYLATIFLASAGIISLMTNAIVSPGGNNFVIYSENLYTISLILPLVFFVIFAITGLAILLTGKESYKYDNKLIQQTYKFKTLLAFIEFVQLIAWLFFLIILIAYFYPINKTIAQIYQEQIATADFTNRSIQTGLLSFISINNNFFADLKLSVLKYAATLPYFFNKDVFSLSNIIYFALYITLFIPFLKLSLFKPKQRALALIPFSGLVLSYLRSTRFNHEELITENNENLKWYQKILLSNKTVFQIKLTSTVVYLSFFFLVGVLTFTALASYFILTDGYGYTLIPSDTYVAAYSIDFLNYSISEKEILLSLFWWAAAIIMLIVFIVFSMGIILDDNPFVFPKAIRKNKYTLSLTLVVIEIAQWAFLLLVWIFFISNASWRIISSVEVVPAVYPTPEPVKPDLTNLIYSSSDLFTTTNLFFVALYLSWFLIYAKAGMFSKRTRIFMYIPFATLFFVPKHVIEKRKQVNKFNCRLI
ncbi:hypothetical protein RUS47_00485 [Mycoplasmoides gallisepticum]|uniref:hypothetical protein n=1 Tax=Mycoplasmoides gallisepticum TaxID=2096 RepID=UPI001247E24A|nr:hypothetical protein [Mycoplasmoides gallisepticum]QEX47053.1 hypothetical protein F6J63_00490 [Mycoplasmoides gallisepticum]ULH62357.1 hypothetical protein MHC98_00495 [Mycoplasmoides gallisepticum]ULH67696.1 hypothetical protein MHC97_00495 [Mycoplasmoides gallisepticum]ULH68423.1 hypothetical protein MHC99_00490 [Mycoplasmoides gallisepticum]WGG24064.1 hypothetical protein P0D30_00495 [Mycoplasmoides gallisepticum]